MLRYPGITARARLLSSLSGARPTASGDTFATDDERPRGADAAPGASPLGDIIRLGHRRADLCGLGVTSHPRERSGLYRPTASRIF